MISESWKQFNLAFFPDKEKTDSVLQKTIFYSKDTGAAYYYWTHETCKWVSLSLKASFVALHHHWQVFFNHRSIRLKVFCENRCSQKFRKIQRKTPVPESLLNKVRPEACNFIIKETLAQVFSSEFCEISKNTFYYRTPLVAASVTSERQGSSLHPWILKIIWSIEYKRKWPQTLYNKRRSTIFLTRN